MGSCILALAIFAHAFVIIQVAENQRFSLGPSDSKGARVWVLDRKTGQIDVCFLLSKDGKKIGQINGSNVHSKCLEQVRSPF